MTDTDIDTAAEVREDPYDELDGSPIPEQVLGAEIGRASCRERV